MNRLRHILLCLVLILGLGLRPGDEQDDMPLAVKDQIPLLVKILSYDKNLSERGEELVLGVVYQERYRQSLLTRREVEDAMAAIDEIAGLPVRVVPIAIDDDQRWQSTLADAGVNLLYITPLRAYALDTMVDYVRTRQILTLTGVPAYAEAGLSVSLDVKGGRAQIVINLAASEAEGARFPSQLLRFARVIR